MRSLNGPAGVMIVVVILALLYASMFAAVEFPFHPARLRQAASRWGFAKRKYVDEHALFGTEFKVLF